MLSVSKLHYQYFLCDALKGAAGVVLLSSYGPMYMILGGILAMMGHNWSIFLGFKGGRGVATGLGVLIALSPLVALLCFLVWGIIVYFTKLVSLGSIVAAALVPVLCTLQVNLIGLLALVDWLRYLL